MNVLRILFTIGFVTFLDANISADAYTEAQNSKCGASGGTVILDAVNVSMRFHLICTPVQWE